MHESTGPGAAEGEQFSEWALTHLPSNLRFWMTAGAVLWLDLWSKDWVFTSLRPDETRSFIANLVVFRRSLNDGAVFGSFTGQVGLFIVASLFALGFVFYLFAHSPRKRRGLHVALACILAGALGNLYDRAWVHADIVTYRLPNGQQSSVIGTIVDETKTTIRLGEWPEGKRPRTFERSHVNLRRQGVVRDFIKFVPRFPSWFPRLGKRDIWPWVFNVADAALVCGVGALLWTSWFHRHARQAP